MIPDSTSPWVRWNQRERRRLLLRRLPRRCPALLCLLLLASCRAEPSATNTPPAAPADALAGDYCIALTGTAHRWTANYPVTNGLTIPAHELRPGQALHVPAEVNVVLLLKSTDYLYTMSIPGCGLKEIAVPGLEFRLAHRWEHPGQELLEGEELCGAPAQRGAWPLIVERQDEFLDWLRRTHTSN